MTLEVRTTRLICGVIVTGALLGCGDAPTTDERGYTKAPLEQPGVSIKPESTTVMDQLGTPILPRDTLIPPAPAAPAAGAASQPKN